MRGSRAFTAALLLILPLAVSASLGQQLSPYDSVDPLIGTLGGGNTFPGATLPFGMVQWSPDTGADGWYFYNDKKIYGFSATHLSGAGCPLYGDFAVLPTTAELTSSPGADFGPYAADFDHTHEEAHPGYYAVTLANGVKAEITIADRAGIARFRFPAGKPARLLINAGSSADVMAARNSTGPEADAYHNRIELKGDDSFTGSSSAGGFCWSHSRYKIYVTGRFDKPWKKTAAWRDEAVTPGGTSADGKHTGVWLDFGDAAEVVLKIGVSFVGEAGASANLQNEVPAWDFDQIHRQARRRWSDLLDRIAVEGGTADQRKIFYTGVYHSFLSPNLFSDANGDYIGFDGKVHSVSTAGQAAQYANFSDWDIYRNTVQLQSLFEPERVGDMMQSLVNDAEQSGWYPRWPAANDVTYVMGGDSPVILLASSYAFGARHFDTAAALRYAVKAGTEPGLGPHNTAERPYLADYRKLGYVPVERDPHAASITLEYANADFATAQFAKTLGDRDAYRTFMKQSENWKTLLDPATGWVRPRRADGSWLEGFDAERSLPKRPDQPNNSDQYGFEEGNTYQYTFMLPFDYPGLFAAIGGEDKVQPRLDKFFSKLICWGEPCFNMANEPDFVSPYAYLFAGTPWKAQQVITRIENETFKTTPDGIPGNDDLGATSGVYVWNALGLYPAVPGVGGLAIGTPLFDRATLRLAGDRTVILRREGVGPYVQKLSIDGAEFPGSWLPLTNLRKGRTELRFVMAEQPNKERGTAEASRPPSFNQPQ